MKKCPFAGGGVWASVSGSCHSGNSERGSDGMRYPGRVSVPQEGLEVSGV